MLEACVALDFLYILISAAWRHILGIQPCGHPMTVQSWFDGTQLMSTIADKCNTTPQWIFSWATLRVWSYSWRNGSKHCCSSSPSSGAMPFVSLEIVRHEICHHAYNVLPRARQVQILPVGLDHSVEEKHNIVHATFRCRVPISQPSMAFSRTLRSILDQPKPLPRPLAALVPLPILLPLAAGMVPLPLPTDVPAAV